MTITPYHSYTLSEELRAAKQLYKESPGYVSACLVQSAKRDRDNAVSTLRGQLRLVS